jgi:integrase/recombinase XerD
MIEDMTVRDRPPATERSYVHAAAKVGHFFGRTPEWLEPEEERAFQIHLVAGSIWWPARNQTICALHFLCGVTLGRADLPERICNIRSDTYGGKTDDRGVSPRAGGPDVAEALMIRV